MLYELKRQFLMSLLAIIVGWLLLFAMNIRLLPPSFVTSFLGYGLTVVGLIGGVDAILKYFGQRHQ